MQQDLNDALIFAKVVEQGSFTAASKLLSIPKTTVSRKIQALELRLGARLLNRTTRRLSLTEAGGVYYDYCHRIVQDLGEAESAVQRSKATLAAGCESPLPSPCAPTSPPRSCGISAPSTRK